MTEPIRPGPAAIDAGAVDGATCEILVDARLIASSKRDDLHHTRKLAAATALIDATRRSSAPPSAASRAVLDTLPAAIGEPPSSLDPRALLGRTLGAEYRLEAIIAVTASSAVYRAVHLTLDRVSAVKVLTAMRSASSDATARFLQEARAAAALRHPAFVRVFECAVTSEGLPYFAMELLEGETLHARLKRETRLDPRAAAEIGADVAAALAALHGQGWIHRDVKPSNIFLLAAPSDGQVLKLLDLGVVRRNTIEDGAEVPVSRTGRAAIQTIAGVILGTPRYLSPEQAVGDTLDARSDLYALGVVLYEALTGSAPFRDVAMSELLMAHVTELPEPISLRAPDAEVPEALERLVMQALEKDPSLRPASAATMELALRQASAPCDAEPPAIESAPPARPADRRAPRILAALVAVAAVLTPALWLGGRRSPGLVAPAVPVPAEPAPAASALVVDTGSPAPSATARPEPLPGASAPSASVSAIVPRRLPARAPRINRLDDLKDPFR